MPAESAVYGVVAIGEGAMDFELPPELNAHLPKLDAFIEAETKT